MYKIEVRLADKNNKEFIIDAEDLELVSAYTWSVTPENYVKTYIEKSRLDPSYTGKRERRVVYLHRLVMQATDDEIIDHISQDRTDNRKCNLRLATKSLNSLNSNKSRGAVPYRGVRLNKQKGKPYIASITVDGKSKHLGVFNNPEEAHKAYLKAQKEVIHELSNRG